MSPHREICLQWILKRSHGEEMRAAESRRLDAPMFPRNLSHQAILKKKNQKADLVVHHEHKHWAASLVNS